MSASDSEDGSEGDSMGKTKTRTAKSAEDDSDDEEEEDAIWEDIDVDEDDGCTLFDIESPQSNKKVFAEDKWTGFLVSNGSIE